MADPHTGSGPATCIPPDVGQLLAQVLPSIDLYQATYGESGATGLTVI